MDDEEMLGGPGLRRHDGDHEADGATEALAFMVVGLRGHGKAPFHPTRRVLLSRAVEELRARDVGVVRDQFPTSGDW